MLVLGLFASLMGSRVGEIFKQPDGCDSSVFTVDIQLCYGVRVPPCWQFNDSICLI